MQLGKTVSAKTQRRETETALLLLLWRSFLKATQSHASKREAYIFTRRLPGNT